MPKSLNLQKQVSNGSTQCQWAVHWELNGRLTCHIVWTSQVKSTCWRSWLYLPAVKTYCSFHKMSNHRWLYTAQTLRSPATSDKNVEVWMTLLTPIHLTKFDFPLNFCWRRSAVKYANRNRILFKNLENKPKWKNRNPLRVVLNVLWRQKDIKEHPVDDEN